MTEKTALVVGGGIAGAVAALALKRAGMLPVVYEAYGRAADGVGGMLTVAPNGLAALEQVGAREAVEAAGVPMSDGVLTDGCGRAIGVMPALKGQPPGTALWRPALYRALRERVADAGIPTEFGKQLVDVEEDDGGVTACFADATTATGDILVGADGIRSVVRNLIDPNAPGPRHVPLLNVGGTARVDVGAKPETSYFAFGKRGFLGYWAQTDGTTAWFGNIPHDGEMSSAEARRKPDHEWLRWLREVFADDRPGATLLEHTSVEDVFVLGTVQIMPDVPRWHRGRMVLVGDSVHAPSPSSGQGASLAAESAVELARCLRDVPDPSGAFAAYEGLRRGRVRRVAKRAERTNGSKTLGPVALTMMKLMMPLMTRTFLTPERTLGEEQRFRVDWDAPVHQDAAPAKQVSPGR